MRRKKENRTKKIMIILMGFILVVSMFGIALFGGSPTDANTISLNISNKLYDFRINQEADKPQYTLLLDDKELDFYTLPYQLNDITIDEKSKSKIKESLMLYTTFDPDIPDISYVDFLRFQLTQNYAQMNVYTIGGVSSIGSSYNLPIITCANASQSVPVLYIQQSNTTEIISDNDCVYIKGHSADFIRVRDLLLYIINDVI